MQFKQWGVAISLAVWSYALTAAAKPIQYQNKTVAGASVQVVTVDLSDPQTYLKMFLANNAPQANSNDKTYGAEPFGAMVKRAQAAAVINGTFFSKDAQQRVMGNMASGGQLLKYSQWENFGTTFGLLADGKPEMKTLRASESLNWKQHWFSITCGPRLLRQGQVWLHPDLEGFKDPHVLNTANRSALGFSQDGKSLYLVSFLGGVNLQREAEVMKALGAYEAMNLDGGASQALAVKGSTLVAAGRNLTNVIAVYDSQFPAPMALKQSRQNFQMASTATPTDLPAPCTGTACHTPTPATLATPKPTPVESVQPLLPHSQAHGAAQVPQLFFTAVNQKIYHQAWSLFTEASKKAIVNQIIKAAGAAGTVSVREIRRMLDENDPELSPLFWDAFRENVGIERWVQQKYRFVSGDQKRAVIKAEPLNLEMSVFFENGQWRLGYMESFAN